MQLLILFFNLETIRKVSAIENATTKTTIAILEKWIETETVQTEIDTTTDRIDQMTKMVEQEIDQSGTENEVVRSDLGLIVGLNLARDLKNVRDIHMVIIRPVTHPLFVIVRDEKETHLAT